VFAKAYLWVFCALIAAGMGFPIPEEIPIVTAGVLVGHGANDPVPDPELSKVIAAFSATPDTGFPATLAVLTVPKDYFPPVAPASRPRWWIMLPVCIIGVVLSDSILYGIGRFWGPRLLDAAWVKRLVPVDKRQNIECNFHKYGIYVLLFARFMPAIRSPIFIMAGVMRVSLAKFVLADGIYALPGVSLLFFLAYWFGNQFAALVESAEGKVSTARPIIILALIAAVAGYLVYHFWRHPVATGDPRKEIPVIGQQVADTIVHPDSRPTGPDHSEWVATDGSIARDAAKLCDQEANGPAAHSPDASAQSTGA
jgi:membrane protein DedA with SNARE-associated domain